MIFSLKNVLKYKTCFFKVKLFIINTMEKLL